MRVEVIDRMCGVDWRCSVCSLNALCLAGKPEPCKLKLVRRVDTSLNVEVVFNSDPRPLSAKTHDVLP